MDEEENTDKGEGGGHRRDTRKKHGNGKENGRRQTKIANKMGKN